jgi:hypothetical protein
MTWVSGQFIFALCATFANQHVRAVTSPVLPGLESGPKAKAQAIGTTDTPGGQAQWSDDLQTAWDVDLQENKHFEISPENVASGKDLLSGPIGTLYVKFAKGMLDFIAYYAKVIDGSGQPNLNTSRVYPDKEHMKNVLAEWRVEVLKFEHCPEEALDMEACMGVTRCVVESEVGKSISAPYFATFMDIHEQVVTIVMKDFELYFQEPKVTKMPVCVGEPHASNSNVHEMASFMDQFEASSERQWRAASAVAMVQQAADLTERVSASAHDSTATHFQDIWHPPCAALGCDKGSLPDIGQTLHGHVSELMEVNAPGPVIRMYVRAMRKAILASKMWIGQASSEDFGIILKTPGQHAASNRIYNQQLKRVAGVLEGAYALLMLRSGGGQDAQKEVVRSTSSSGWWGRRRRRRRRRTRRRRRNRRRRSRRRRSRRRRFRRRRRNRRRRRRWGLNALKAIGSAVSNVVEVLVEVFSCVGVAAGGLNAYVKKIMFSATLGVVFGITVGGGIGAGSLLSMINGHQICVGVVFKIVFSAIIGLVVGDPSAAMARAGVTIEAGITVSGCTGALNIGISAGIAGAVVHLSTSCIFGANLAAVGAPNFKCAYGVAIGLTVFCCTFNVLNQQNNCR